MRTKDQYFIKSCINKTMNFRQAILLIISVNLFLRFLSHRENVCLCFTEDTEKYHFAMIR